MTALTVIAVWIAIAAFTTAAYVAIRALHRIRQHQQRDTERSADRSWAGAKVFVVQHQDELNHVR